jgi:hypothetical protein
MLGVYDEALRTLATAVENGTVEQRLDGQRVGASLRERLDEEE